MKRLKRLACAAVAACAMSAVAAPLAAAAPQVPAPKLHWSPCPKQTDMQCTRMSVPLSYRDPRGGHMKVFLYRSLASDPAHRIGTLFVNFGGPGEPASDIFAAYGTDLNHLWPGLNARYDIIAMDPRGVGRSENVDCKVDELTQSFIRRPYTTPMNLNVKTLVAKDKAYIRACIRRNPHILAHLSTANVARDMDLLRRAVGERKLTYLGYSYGTFLGATYASMFPHNYRAMVLDGPIDADAYINDPMADLNARSEGYERALERFFQACAGDQVACSGFGGRDPWTEFDKLVARANRHAIPAGKLRPVTGDDILWSARNAVYGKGAWGDLGKELAMADAGDATLVRQSLTPEDTRDSHFVIGAGEQRYPHDVSTYLRAGLNAWTEHEHFWFNNGYVELNYGLWPIHDKDAFYGPFRVPRTAVTPLVVATTFDPATPYHGALNLVRELGNARLLTMRGDGHTAYPGSSACIDAAVNGYLVGGKLPPAGTYCDQEVPFTAPSP